MSDTNHFGEFNFSFALAQKAKADLQDQHQKLLDRIIKASSNEGDLILDPFLGSGNTIKSCIKLKRNYIGMEMSAEYFNSINLS